MEHGDQQIPAQAPLACTTQQPGSSTARSDRDRSQLPIMPLSSFFAYCRVVVRTVFAVVAFVILLLPLHLPLLAAFQTSGTNIHASMELSIVLLQYLSQPDADSLASNK